MNDRIIDHCDLAATVSAIDHQQSTKSGGQLSSGKEKHIFIVFEANAQVVGGRIVGEFVPEAETCGGWRVGCGGGQGQ